MHLNLFVERMVLNYVTENLFLAVKTFHEIQLDCLRNRKFYILFFIFWIFFDSRVIVWKRNGISKVRSLIRPSNKDIGARFFREFKESLRFVLSILRHLFSRQDSILGDGEVAGEFLIIVNRVSRDGELCALVKVLWWKVDGRVLKVVPLDFIIFMENNKWVAFKKFKSFNSRPMCFDRGSLFSVKDVKVFIILDKKEISISFYFAFCQRKKFHLEFRKKVKFIASKDIFFVIKNHIVLYQDNFKVPSILVYLHCACIFEHKRVLHSV